MGGANDSIVFEVGFKQFELRSQLDLSLNSFKGSPLELQKHKFWFDRRSETDLRCSSPRHELKMEKRRISSVFEPIVECMSRPENDHGRVGLELKEDEDFIF